MANKDHNLEFLKGKLNDLERDYQTVTSQLRTEQDGPTQNKLERQLGQIGQEMDEREKQIQARKRELQENALDELREILQRQDVQFDEMQQAYQATVKARSFNRRTNIETSESLITEILRIPKGKSDSTAIEEFAAWLTFISKNGDLINLLQGWGEQHCKDWSELLGQIEAQRDEQDQNVQTALFIMISYSDEAATQSQDGEEYRVQMWLIENVEQYRKYRQGYRTVGLDINSGLTGDETYSKEGIPGVLKKFFEQGNVVAQLPQDSEVHIFLPQQLLLDCDADCWKLIKRMGKELPIGHDYQVFVRLHKRLERHYNPKMWKDKWKQLPLFLNKKASEGFKSCKNYDLELYYELRDEGNENVVGLTLIDAPNQDSSTSIFELIYDLGFPLALWGRSNLSESTNEVELNRVLEACILANLRQTVQRERGESRNKPTDSHIGHHLSLLWDDPELVPPKSA